MNMDRETTGTFVLNNKRMVHKIGKTLRFSFLFLTNFIQVASTYFIVKPTIRFKYVE